MRSTLLMLALLATHVVSQSQPLYKSVDANGKVVYSDRPPATGVASTLEQAQLPISVVPGMPPPPAGKTAAPKVGLPPQGKTVLYMARWCGYCRMAKAYLGQNSIPYQEFDIDTPSGKAAFADIGGRGVPVLLADGQRVNGFTARAYDAVFTKRKTATQKK